MSRIERSRRGRHRRIGREWIPLPVSPRPGRHLHRGAGDRLRRTAAASVVGVLMVVATMAAAFPPSDAVDRPPASDVTAAAPARPAASMASPSPEPVERPAPPTTSLLVDPSPDQMLAMRPPPPPDTRPAAEPVPSMVMGMARVSMGGVAFEPPPAPRPDRDDCIGDARSAPLRVDGVWDRNLVAQMTHEVFGCLAGVAGLDEEPPTASRRWDGAERWGFGSLAEQVSAEAVVVAYCESLGFDGRALTHSNGHGYAGLFQMGAVEMRRFGERGSSRFDPVDNAVAAATYFLHQYEAGAGWGGWSPWAVVNTNFDDPINNQVRVPVLPRFVSTDRSYRGRPGPDLPAWAVDPWTWEVPSWRGTGCSFTGRRWPAAEPLEG